MLFSLIAACFKGTRSRSKYDSVRLYAMRNAKFGGVFISEPLTLSNLFRSPRSHKAKKRYRGDGTGSRLNGRGSKGQKSRSGHGIPRGFEGGQTELRFRFPRKSKQVKLMEKAYNGYGRMHLDQIQRWIDIGRLDASKPLTLASFYDAGLRSIRRGLLITDGGSEHFTHRIHIEATEFTPEAIGRIEELGGKAISVYHSMEDIKILTRPEFYFFTEARKLVMFKRYIAALSSYLSSRSLPGDSVQALKERLTDAEFHNFFMNAKFEAGRVLERRNMTRFCLYDVFGEEVINEPDCKTLVDRSQVKLILKERPDSLSAKLIKDFLPPFSAPEAFKDIRFFQSDEKRGYLSNYVLTKIVSHNITSNQSIPAVADENPPAQSEDGQEMQKQKPGLKYWIDRKYTVTTRDAQLYDAISEEYNWINKRLESLKAQQKAKDDEISQRDRVLALLREKGLTLDVARYIGPKEPWRIKKEGSGEVILMPIDYNAADASAVENNTTENISDAKSENLAT